MATQEGYRVSGSQQNETAPQIEAENQKSEAPPIKPAASEKPQSEILPANLPSKTSKKKRPKAKKKKAPKQKMVSVGGGVKLPGRKPSKLGDTRGRKPEFEKNPKLIKDLIQVLKAGNTEKTAYEYVRISADTYYEWIRTYPDFAEMVSQAKAHARAYVMGKHLENVRDKDQKAINSWQRALGGPEFRDRIEVSGPGGGPIDLTNLSTEELLARIGELSSDLKNLSPEILKLVSKS